MQNLNVGVFTKQVCCSFACLLRTYAYRHIFPLARTEKAAVLSIASRCKKGGAVVKENLFDGQVMIWKVVI